MWWLGLLQLWCFYLNWKKLNLTFWIWLLERLKIRLFEMLTLWFPELVRFHFFLNRPWNTGWQTYSQCKYSEMFSLQYLISRIILVIILMLLYGLYSIFIGLFGNSIFFWQPISAPKIITTYIILLSINIGSSGKFIKMTYCINYTV